MIHKNTAEVEKIKNKASKKSEGEEKVIAKDYEKDLLDTDDKNEEL